MSVAVPQGEAYRLQLLAGALDELKWIREAVYDVGAVGGINVHGPEYIALTPRPK